MTSGAPLEAVFGPVRTHRLLPDQGGIRSRRSVDHSAQGAPDSATSPTGAALGVVAARLPKGGNYVNLGERPQDRRFHT